MGIKQIKKGGGGHVEFKEKYKLPAGSPSHYHVQADPSHLEPVGLQLWLWKQAPLDSPPVFEDPAGCGQFSRYFPKPHPHDVSDDLILPCAVGVTVAVSEITA